MHCRLQSYITCRHMLLAEPTNKQIYKICSALTVFKFKNVGNRFVEETLVGFKMRKICNKLLDNFNFLFDTCSVTLRLFVNRPIPDAWTDQTDELWWVTYVQYSCRRCRSVVSWNAARICDQSVSLESRRPRRRIPFARQCRRPTTGHDVGYNANCFGTSDPAQTFTLAICFTFVCLSVCLSAG